MPLVKQDSIITCILELFNSNCYLNCIDVLRPCTVWLYFPFCRDAQASVEVGKRLHIGRILLPLAGARTSVPSNIQTRISRGRALTAI